MNRMKTSKLIIAALVAVALAGIVVGASGCKKSEHEHGAGEQPGHEQSAAKKYTCPMHSEVVQDKAGNCPKCGMALVEKR